jgi:hypothetical protein
MIPQRKSGKYRFFTATLATFPGFLAFKLGFLRFREIPGKAAPAGNLREKLETTDI